MSEYKNPRDKLISNDFSVRFILVSNKKNLALKGVGFKHRSTVI